MLFHFRQAIYRKWKTSGLSSKFTSSDSQKILDNLASLYWSQDKSKINDSVLQIKNQYKDFPDIISFIDYFDQFCIPKILNDQINYNIYDEKYRFNSVLETFIQKLKLI